MLRSGGEMSNFTTGMTPRYWARTMGCESARLAGGSAGLRKQNECDRSEAKQNGD